MSLLKKQAKSNGKEVVLKTHLIRIREELLSLVYPKICFGCKKTLAAQSNVYFCEKCWDVLKNNFKPPFCKICGRSLESCNANISKCADCESYNWHFSQGFSATVYDGMAKECIHSFKYKFNTYLADSLAQLMIDYANNYNDNFANVDVIVPVPLHWRKLRQRGFNQTKLLAIKLGNAFNVPVETRGLSRFRYTPSQTGLPRQQRIKNVNDVFIARKPEVFIAKKVLLIDDVFTTGSTLNECSKVILKSGARDVSVFSLARGI